MSHRGQTTINLAMMITIIGVLIGATVFILDKFAQAQAETASNTKDIATLNEFKDNTKDVLKSLQEGQKNTNEKLDRLLNRN